MSWDPDQYNRFKQQRAAPFRDLTRWLKVRPGLSAVDLGCGTGELTRQLADLLPDSLVLGVDTSAEMLNQSQAFARPGLSFRQQNLADVEGKFDLIFSHAALHWVENHPWLFARLWDQLLPGGQLLVQMPHNFDHLSHRLAADIAQNHFHLRTRVTEVLAPEDYAELLYHLGAQDFEVVLKVYPHVLADAQAIVEWTRGTLLTAYLPQLSPVQQSEFLDIYSRKIHEQMPEKPVFYGFKRLLLQAIKA